MTPLRLTGISVLAAAAMAACSSGGARSVPPPAGQGPAGAPVPAQEARGFDYLSRFVARDRQTGQYAHVMPPDSRAAAPAPTPTPTVQLEYRGGRVQTTPRVYTVFWGSTWINAQGQDGPGDPDHVRGYLKRFIKAAAGSAWLNDVLQYTQQAGSNYFGSFPAGTAGNPASMFTSSWVDTGTVPAAPSLTDFVAEAQRAAAHFGDYGVDVQYVIATPSGIVPPGFGTDYCAYHTFSYQSNTPATVVGFAALPYQPDKGCYSNRSPVNPSVVDGVSIVAGHEIAEIITDPVPQGYSNAITGWTDANGEEIGDKCYQGPYEAIDFGSAGTFPTQPLWNNGRTSCRQYPGGGV